MVKTKESEKSEKLIEYLISYLGLVLALGLIPVLRLFIILFKSSCPRPASRDYSKSAVKEKKKKKKKNKNFYFNFLY